MIQIRQPFFSIVTSAIFALLGVLYGLNAGKGVSTMIGGVEMNTSGTWAFTGLMFLMAYFALVHMKYDRK
jgi:hypothetical protein